MYGAEALDEETLLNVAASFLKIPLSIAICAKNLANFTAAPNMLYDGKNICVTGKIIDYKGKAGIIATRLSDLQI